MQPHARAHGFVTKTIHCYPRDYLPTVISKD
jgi:hypothetical protein